MIDQGRDTLRGGPGEDFVPGRKIVASLTLTSTGFSGTDRRIADDVIDGDLTPLQFEADRDAGPVLFDASALSTGVVLRPPDRRQWPGSD